jgi:hypothetical protein
MTRYPSQLFLDVRLPIVEGESGTATLRAREWVLCPPEGEADCRIIPTAGVVHTNAEAGQLVIEIHFRALSSKPPPPDPPLIVLP